MAIAQAENSVSSSGSGTSAAVTLPTYAAGERVLIAMTLTEGSTDPAINLSGTPSGWTLVANTNNGNASAIRQIVLSKTMTGSEGSSLSVNFASSTGWHALAATFEASEIGQTGTASGSSTTGDAPGIATPDSSDPLFVLIWSADDDDPTAGNIDNDFNAGAAQVAGTGYIEQSTPGNGMNTCMAIEAPGAGAYGGNTFDNQNAEHWATCTVELLVGGIAINDAGDETFVEGEQNITITGTQFEASQGSGKVEIGDNASYGAATLVELAIDSWSDTSIQIDIEETGTGNPISDDLTLGALYLFVTNDSAEVSASFSVTVSEPGATWAAALNTEHTLSLDANFRLRFLVQEASGASYDNQGFKLQYRLNDGTWTDVNGASSVIRASASTHVTDAADTTQLIGVGSFVSPNDGFDEADGAVGGAALDGAGNDEVELEFCIQARSADVSGGDTVDLRLVESDGTAFDTYTEIPRWTIAGGAPADPHPPAVLIGL